MNTPPEQLRDIPEGVQATHWPSCWREHRACAIARVELAEARVAEVDQALLACQERCHELEAAEQGEAKAWGCYANAETVNRELADYLAKTERRLTAAEARSVRLAEVLDTLATDTQEEWDVTGGYICGVCNQITATEGHKDYCAVRAARAVLAEYDASQAAPVVTNRERRLAEALREYVAPLMAEIEAEKQANDGRIYEGRLMADGLVRAHDVIEHADLLAEHDASQAAPSGGS